MIIQDDLASRGMAARAGGHSSAHPPGHRPFPNGRWPDPERSHNVLEVAEGEAKWNPPSTL